MFGKEKDPIKHVQWMTHDQLEVVNHLVREFLLDEDHMSFVLKTEQEGAFKLELAYYNKKDDKEFIINRAATVSKRECNWIPIEG